MCKAIKQIHALMPLTTVFNCTRTATAPKCFIPRLNERDQCDVRFVEHAGGNEDIDTFRVPFERLTKIENIRYMNAGFHSDVGGPPFV
jgi:hypothetical protein